MTLEAATGIAPEFISTETWEGRTARTDLGIWTWFFGQANKRERLDNSTAFQPSEADVRQEVEHLFSVAREEVLEDGIESEFSNGLIRLIVKYEGKAMDWITNLILDQSSNEELVSEALRWLGRMEHSPSHDRRLWLLERCLLSSSARVRDAASVALASLDDTHAISYLADAIGTEQYEELREDMRQVLVQLENTLQCR